MFITVFDCYTKLVELCRNFTVKLSEWTYWQKENKMRPLSILSSNLNCTQSYAEKTTQFAVSELYNIVMCKGAKNSIENTQRNS